MCMGRTTNCYDAAHCRAVARMLLLLRARINTAIRLGRIMLLRATDVCRRFSALADYVFTAYVLLLSNLLAATGADLFTLDSRLLGLFCLFTRGWLLYVVSFFICDSLE